MDLTHGKYLGVDYGDKRTGLAECDPIAFPSGVAKRPNGSEWN